MEHIRDAFNPIAAQYDAQREFIIPEIKQYYGAAVWVSEVLGPASSILDIGAGTGLLSAMILHKFPDAEMTLMDIAANMLDVAKERFAGRENIRYVVRDYSRSDLGGPYDLICSALSIHHLATEDKCRLFLRIFSSLKPGGMFVNADQADGETLYFRNRYMEYWNEFLKSGPLNTEENREILKRRDNLDKNEKLSVQLGWLRDAGFSDVDVVYRNRTFIVTVARRA